MKMYENFWRKLFVCLYLFLFSFEKYFFYGVFIFFLFSTGNYILCLVILFFLFGLGIQKKYIIIY